LHAAQASLFRGRRLGTREDARAAIVDGPSQRVVAARDALFRRSLAAADVVALCLGLVLAVAVLGDDPLRPVSLLAAPVVIVASKLLGLYDRDELLLRKSTLDEAPALFQLATILTLMAWLVEPLVTSGSLGAYQVLALWGVLCAGFLCLRAAARWVAQRLSPAERCLLLGDLHDREQFRERLEHSDGVDAELVGQVHLPGGSAHEAAMGELEAAIEGLDVHRVILAPRLTDTDEMLDVIRLVKGLGVRVSLLPRVFEVVGSAVVFDDLRGANVLAVRRFGLTRSSRWAKRSLDLAGAALGLLAVAPLMLAIAVAIKLDGRGCVLFGQTRVGRDGRQFQMRKFRTMVPDAEARKDGLRALNEAHGLFKMAEDPRVTRVGRFLRRTSLDELPQLLNVLRGDMSLVGPRPLVVDEDLKVQGWHRRRLHLTPGMTGHWQILGSARIPLSDMVKIDYLYVANWSFWTDIKILLRTVPCMLRRSEL